MEINGVFYELPKPNKAIPVTQKLPKSVIDSLGDRFKILEDGTLDANFLTKGTPSFKQYFVLNSENQIIQSLEEYDSNLESIKSNTKK